MKMLGRIINNTKKQISRSGWAGWGSIGVMTMAFLVASIFGGLAYISNLYINFIEQKSNLLVFFEVGVEQEVVDELRAKWETHPNIKDISFTSEEVAYDLYSDYTARVRPEIYAVLKTQDQKKLPASLDIQIYSLDELEVVQADLQKDIEEKLKELIIIEAPQAESEEDDVESDAVAAEDGEVDASVGEGEEQVKYKYSKDPFDPPIELKVDNENLDQLREVFFAVRIVGVGVITLLFVVIFFFTFMTVEFRLSNQMEEIGVMQLVGGSLLFIRAPYVLEGGFYGVVGSLISSLLIGLVLIFQFALNPDSAVSLFVYENFSKLAWPDLSYISWGAVIIFMSIIGFILGSMSSYLSIKRYIR